MDVFATRSEVEQPSRARTRWLRTVAAALKGVLAACGDSAPGMTDDVAVDADTVADTFADDADAAVDTAVAPFDSASDTSTGVAPLPSCIELDPSAADPTEALFAPDCVMDVRISLGVSDWYDLRHETRSITDVIGIDCGQEPPADVFNWYQGDVTVAGVTVAGAGVRKKGFLGSLDSDRPSLKVRFDKFIEGQRLSGMKRLTLNNMRQDPGVVNTCLAYGVMRRFGVVTPRCNFARVWVNGNDLGIYAHVESVKKPFIARHFSSDEGNLYEATLSDFREGYTATWEKKTNEAEADWSDIEAVTAALTVSDDGLMPTLEPLVDLDAFYTFWAAEVIVGHWDGYAGNINNTYVYADPADGRFQFIPWGADAVFARPPEILGNTELPPPSVMARGLLTHRLYNHFEGRPAYLERLLMLLETHWDTDEVLGELDRMAALVVEHIPLSERLEFYEAIEEKRAWIAARETILYDQVVTGGVDWTLGLADNGCWQDAGTIAGTFDTVWGTEGREWPAGGLGFVELTINGEPVTFSNVQANAREGFSGDTEGEAIIEVNGLTEGGQFIFAAFIGPLEAVQSSGSAPVDWKSFRGWLGRSEGLYLDFDLIGLLVDGSLTFNEAQTWQGQVVEGSFEARVLSEP